ncbi:HAD family hydrolase [Microlunatus flavus]|uniref:Phosphoglycolate phosphatase n=1 Tax=Microlunatus flavus TaxID=1036181 RepID=A0A1H9I2C1_9ACTN|nr:HAD hydrolase-like protein [Microlunatus flavus]SEQ68761.1 phosphoglycolate phosphatase [Microlunatus flavus]
MSRLPRWSDVSAVVLDVDGTVLDSADGIVAGFRHALVAVGVSPPTDEGLRSDVGPQLVTLLPALGVPPERLAAAVAAYRSFYLHEGLHQARPYEGVSAVLDRLAAELRLGTATAKRTDVAVAILEAHGLAGRFEVVNGLADDHPTKAATLAQTLDLLGGIDPAHAVMVGDRHSDVVAGREVGTRTVGVLWGYGSRSELEDAGADVLLEHPSELVDLLLG